MHHETGDALKLQHFDFKCSSNRLHCWFFLFPNEFWSRTWWKLYAHTLKYEDQAWSESSDHGKLDLSVVVESLPKEDIQVWQVYWCHVWFLNFQSCKIQLPFTVIWRSFQVSKWVFNVETTTDVQLSRLCAHCESKYASWLHHNSS